MISDTHLFSSAAMLLLAWPLGWLASAFLPSPTSRIARGGTTLLAGLAGSAAILNALLCLGFTAGTGGVICATAGVLGASARVVSMRRTKGIVTSEPGPPVATRVFAEFAAVVTVGLVCATPAFHVHDVIVHDHDAVYIWAPKIARALTEAPPRLSDISVQFHPEYPRGLAVLTAAVGAAFQPIDPRLPRAVPLVIFAAMLLAVFDALACRRNVTGGALAVLILGALPLLVHYGISGLCDVPLAACMVLVTMGLAPTATGARAWPLALAGALGAASLKDEGMIAAVASVAVMLVWALRQRRVGVTLGVVAACVAVLGPWLMLKRQLMQELLKDDPIRGLSGFASMGRSFFMLDSGRQNLGMLLLRVDQLVREVAHLLLGFPDPSPGGVAMPMVTPGANTAGHVALVAMGILVVGRQRVFPILPVGILLAAHFVVVAITPEPLDWQVMTAYDRLLLQATPALVLAAIHRLTAPVSQPATVGTSGNPST